MAQPLSPSYPSTHQPSRMERFSPPLHGDLHAAGARGFERPARVVQPHVHALNEVAGDVHVVVFDEDHAAAELRLARLLHHALDEFLAAVVLRVGLAGEDELHRAVLVC